MLLNIGTTSYCVAAVDNDVLLHCYTMVDYWATVHATCQYNVLVHYYSTLYRKYNLHNISAGYLELYLGIHLRWVYLQLRGKIRK